MIKELSILALTLTVVSGCGGGSSSTQPNNSNTNLSNTTSTGTTSTVLEGTWKKSCSAADPSDPDTHYDIITLSFTGNTFTSDIKNYSDSICSTPLSFSPNPTSSGNLTIGDQLTTTGGLTVTKIDTHITQYNGAPFDIDDYSVFYIDNNILYLGDDSGIKDGSTPSLRSDTLDTAHPFDRQ